MKTRKKIDFIQLENKDGNKPRHPDKTVLFLENALPDFCEINTAKLVWQNDLHVVLIFESGAIGIWKMHRATYRKTEVFIQGILNR